MPYLSGAGHGFPRPFAASHASRPFGLLDAWSAPQPTATDAYRATETFPTEGTRYDESNELPPSVVDSYKDSLEDDESREFFRYGPRSYAEQLAYAQRVHPSAYLHAVTAPPEAQERFQRWRDIDWGTSFLGPDGIVYERNPLFDEPAGARLRRSFENAVGGYEHPSLDDLIDKFGLPDPRENLDPSTRAKVADVESVEQPRTAAAEAWRDWADAQRVNPDTWTLASRLPESIQADYQRGISSDPSDAVRPWVFVGPDGAVYRRDELTREDKLTKVRRAMEHARLLEAQRDAPSIDPWDAFWAAVAAGGLFPAKAIRVNKVPWGGRRGNAQTQARVRQAQEWISEKYPDWEHMAGGQDLETRQRVLERAIKGPGAAWANHSDGLGGDWRPGSLFPDLWYKAPDGRYIAINIAELDSKGYIAQREHEAGFKMQKVYGMEDEDGKALEVWLIKNLPRARTPK